EPEQEGLDGVANREAVGARRGAETAGRIVGDVESTIGDRATAAAIWSAALGDDRIRDGQGACKIEGATAGRSGVVLKGTVYNGTGCGHGGADCAANGACRAEVIHESAVLDGGCTFDNDNSATVIRSAVVLESASSRGKGARGIDGSPDRGETVLQSEIDQ